MSDPIAKLSSRRAVPRATGTTEEKIAKMKRLKSALQVTAENPIPDVARLYKRLRPRTK